MRYLWSIFFTSKKEVKDHKDKNHGITNSKIIIGLRLIHLKENNNNT
jgi:hypothetical protein